MKKILIIGSKGLVGSNFIKLYKKKYLIKGVDKDNNGELENYLKESYDFLLYLALSKGYKSTVFTKDIMYVNVELFRYILEKSIGKIKNVIFFSTGSVYKLNSNVLTEDSEIDYSSENPYIVSKIVSELILQTFVKHYNSVNIIRPFYIYGREQNEKMLIKGIIKKIKLMEEISIGKNGGMIFNPIHVSDVVRFISQIIDNPSIGRNTYNFSGDEVISLENLIFKIGKLIKKEPIIKYNSSKLVYVVAKKKDIFKCKISIDAGIKEML